jgi:hypothetical protein
MLQLLNKPIWGSTTGPACPKEAILAGPLPDSRDVIVFFFSSWPSEYAEEVPTASLKSSFIYICIYCVVLKYKCVNGSYNILEKKERKAM